jgi:hypothetical protein
MVKKSKKSYTVYSQEENYLLLNILHMTKSYGDKYGHIQKANAQELSRKGILATTHRTVL